MGRVAAVQCVGLSFETTHLEATHGRNSTAAAAAAQTAAGAHANQPQGLVPSTELSSTALCAAWEWHSTCGCTYPGMRLHNTSCMSHTAAQHNQQPNKPLVFATATGLPLTHSLVLHTKPTSCTRQNPSNDVQQLGRLSAPSSTLSCPIKVQVLMGRAACVPVQVSIGTIKPRGQHPLVVLQQYVGVITTGGVHSMHQLVHKSVPALLPQPTQGNLAAATHPPHCT